MLTVAVSFSPKPRIVQQLELQVAPGSSIKDLLQTLVTHADWQVAAVAGWMANLNYRSGTAKPN